MRTYFEPKMNISVFDTENVVTTSGPIGEQMKNVNGTFGTASYNNIKSGKTTSVSATWGD